MVLSEKKARTIPILVFISIWLLTFLLYYSSPYPYLQIHAQTVFVVGLSLISFLLGYGMFYLFGKEGFTFLKTTTIRNKFSILFNERKLSLVVIWLSVLTLIGLVLKIKLLSTYAGGFTEYFENPIRARYIVSEHVGKIVAGYSFYETIISYIIKANIPGLLFGGILFAIGDKRRWVGVIPVIVAILWSIITFQRWVLLQSLTFFIVSAGYLAYYLPIRLNKKVLKQIIRVTIIIGLLFVLFTGLLLSIRVDIEKKATQEKVLSFIVESIHLYIAGNIVAFDQFIQTNDQLYYGVSLFRNLFRWFARLGIYNPQLVFSTNYDFIWVGFNVVNTYTYLRVFYEDFGYVGMVILSFLWGWVCHWIIQKYLEKFSLYRLYFVGLIAHALLMSFYSFALLNVIAIVFILLLIRVIEYLVPDIIIAHNSNMKRGL